MAPPGLGLQHTSCRILPMPGAAPPEPMDRKLEIVTDVHDPYRTRGFQHRDHRKAGIVTTDAVYPFARDHLHFPEQIAGDGLAPHKVRELWYWGMDEPNVIVDVTDSIDRQIAALTRHQSQMPGFNVPPGET